MAAQPSTTVWVRGHLDDDHCYLIRLFSIVSFGSNVQEALNRRIAGLQSSASSSELIQEVSVGLGQSVQPPLGGSIREMKRTLNLPDEYSEFGSCFFWFVIFMGLMAGTLRLSMSPGNLFITYSVDAARDMWPFVKFLTNHGFRPVVSTVPSWFWLQANFPLHWYCDLTMENTEIKSVQPKSNQIKTELTWMQILIVKENICPEK